MRNAAVFADDSDFAAPRRAGPRKPRVASRAGKGKKDAKRSRFNMQRIARFAAIGMAATMSLGIMVNALVLQKGHHPAPLFGKTAAVAIAPAPVKAKAVVMPPARPVAPDALPSPEAPTRTVVADRDAEEPRSDAIGRLLASGTLPASAKTKFADKADSKSISGVQRALTKLGFKVPATGTVGPATRKAIEAFEKDRHMPVKGELDRRLVKVLSAESGIKID